MIIFADYPQIPLYGILPDKFAMLPTTAMPLSHYRESLGCCISLPTSLGRRGVLDTKTAELNERENAVITEAAGKIRAVMEGLANPN
jgi:malate/lactate dehydrogenase